MDDDVQRKPGHAIFLITYNGEPIGQAYIRRGNPSMAVTGPFAPYAAYELVRPLFRSFIKAQTVEEQYHFYEARDALDFAVMTQDGQRVPVPWVHIYDMSEEMEASDVAAYEVEFERIRGFMEDDSYWTDDGPT